MMSSELRKLKRISKRVLNRETNKKIKKVERHEKEDLYKHAIRSNLEMRIHYIEQALKSYGENDAFMLIAEKDLLKSKIRYLTIEFDKKDLRKIVKALREIEKRLNRDALKSIKKMDAELNKFINK